MLELVSEVLPVFAVIAVGLLLGKKGFLDDNMLEGFKKIVASVALPVLLFSAFSSVSVDGKLVFLAVFIFLSCALLGIVGHAFAKIFGFPRPAAVFLFQGFEAGMLGYGLFTGLFGLRSLSFFAAADLGQVVFVFTVLMAQMRNAGRSDTVSAAALFKDMLFSPVIIAIILGLLSSLLFQGIEQVPWAEGGMLEPLVTSFSSLITPLVCLVIGYSLKDFRLKGSGSAFVLVILRLCASLALALVAVFTLIPWLGYGRLQSFAVLFLFMLPPPFVIPIFVKEKKDTAYIGTVLSLHTIFSIIIAAILAFLFNSGAAV